ncbi:MAG: hypothetical protein DHS80DRAFT_25518 [Piptocephalis tieghemiana]|nr:MAG: hypothetical protein DHS80DRAFT_25518 [Piptocephalis tieghemiana]
MASNTAQKVDPLVVTFIGTWLSIAASYLLYQGTASLAAFLGRRYHIVPIVYGSGKGDALAILTRPGLKGQLGQRSLLLFTILLAVMLELIPTLLAGMYKATPVWIGGTGAYTQTPDVLMSIDKAGSPGELSYSAAAAYAAGAGAGELNNLAVRRAALFPPRAGFSSYGGFGACAWANCSTQAGNLGLLGEDSRWYWRTVAKGATGTYNGHAWLSDGLTSVAHIVGMDILREYSNPFIGSCSVVAPLGPVSTYSICATDGVVRDGPNEGIIRKTSYTRSLGGLSIIDMDTCMRLADGHSDGPANVCTRVLSSAGGVGKVPSQAVAMEAWGTERSDGDTQWDVLAVTVGETGTVRLTRHTQTLGVWIVGEDTPTPPPNAQGIWSWGSRDGEVGVTVTWSRDITSAVLGTALQSAWGNWNGQRLDQEVSVAGRTPLDIYAAACAGSAGRCGGPKKAEVKCAFPTAALVIAIVLTVLALCVMCARRMRPGTASALGSSLLAIISCTTDVRRRTHIQMNTWDTGLHFDIVQGQGHQALITGDGREIVAVESSTKVDGEYLLPSDKTSDGPAAISVVALADEAAVYERNESG